MTNERGPELVEVVNRRVTVLEALSRPSHKRDLVSKLDLSRSTVDRAVRELDALGLVAHDEEYYRTVAGRLVLELYEGFLADLEEVVAAGELLASLDPDAPMSPAVLRDASVEYAEPPSPAAALDPVVELVEESDEIRALSMAATRPDVLVERFEQRIERGASFQCVFSGEMVEYLRSNYAEEVAELRTAGEFEAYHTDEQIPYGLGLVAAGDDRYTFLTMYDDDHSLRGVVLNDTRPAYRWAERVYVTYREVADPLSLP